MWPYRPQKLTDLLEPEEIRRLIGFGAPLRLRSAVALIERAEDDTLRRFDAEPDSGGAERRSPFCDYLRHGEIGGVTAFAGADRECSLCEARLAERTLGRREGPGGGRTGSEPVRSRCHMGLTDFAAPVVVRESVLAAIVAGQCVEEEEQRGRIAKSTGKIGKLTRGEMRSLEGSGARVEAPIRIADERAREVLLQEIPNVPLVTPGFRDDLAKLTAMIASLAAGRLPAARSRWDEAFLAGLPRPAALPARENGSLDWLRSAVFELRQRLRLEYVAVFARYPPQVDDHDLEALPLAAQSGLALEGEEDISYDPGRALLELDGRRLDPAGLVGEAPARRGGTGGPGSEEDPKAAAAETEETAGSGAGTREAPHREESSAFGSSGGFSDAELDIAERSRRAASSLISALRPRGRSASRWKDVLTKSLVVAPVASPRGLEAVFLFGHPTGDARPESDDLAVLHRAAERLFESYGRLILEVALRKLAGECAGYREELKKHAEAEAAREARRKSPLRPQRFDITKLLEQCLDRERETARERNVSFDVRGVPERLMLQADRNKLEAVLTTVVRHVALNARPDEEQSGPSVLVSLRRERQRMNLVFDMLGEFLGPDERRRLLRSGLPPRPDRGGRASEAIPPPQGASPDEPGVAPGKKEDAGASRATTPDTATSPSLAREEEKPARDEAPGSSPGAPGNRRDAGRSTSAGRRRPSPVSFRECQRYLSWHGGRLALECVRTGKEAESSGRWLGRVIFTVSFRPIEASSEGPGGRDSRGEPEDRERRPPAAAASSGRPAGHADRRGGRDAADRSRGADRPRGAQSGRRPASRPDPSSSARAPASQGADDPKPPTPSAGDPSGPRPDATSSNDSRQATG